MQGFNLFDDKGYSKLLPLCFSRPAADLRIGILTVREKWEKHLNIQESGFLCRHPLSLKFKPVIQDSALAINGRWLPDEESLRLIEQLRENDVLLSTEGDILAFHYTEWGEPENITKAYHKVVSSLEVQMLNDVWDIFSLNGKEIEKDFQLLSRNRTSAVITSDNTCWNESMIFVEEGARIKGSMLNAEHGPIYIGKHAEIMEGSVIRGPFALCEHATVKLSSKIYGPTTVGPHSKVGGELNNVVIQAYSNKGHDGFLGNSVIGEWCNLGADTNNSNLKNNYAEVKLWSYDTGRFVKTGLQFCGLIMGDHSKCGINTMFNTGTVVGVASNIFGSGFPRNFIPSFAWGGASGFTTHQIHKAFETAEAMMSRRKIALSEADKIILEHIFTHTAAYRYWEQ